MACPICSKDTVKEYRPFCSKRCADIDLSKWLSGSYVIAGNTPIEDEEIPEIENKEFPH